MLRPVHVVAGLFLVLPLAASAGADAYVVPAPASPDCVDVRDVVVTWGGFHAFAKDNYDDVERTLAPTPPAPVEVAVEYSCTLAGFSLPRDKDRCDAQACAILPGPHVHLSGETGTDVELLPSSCYAAFQPSPSSYHTMLGIVVRDADVVSCATPWACERTSECEIGQTLRFTTGMLLELSDAEAPEPAEDPRALPLSLWPLIFTASFETPASSSTLTVCQRGPLPSAPLGVVGPCWD